MNRRQKMKKLKRELEQLRKELSVSGPALYRCELYDIRTMVVDRMFSREDETILGKDGIRDILAEDLLDAVNEVMEISRYNARFGYSEAYHYRAELKVAVPRK